MLFRLKDKAMSLNIPEKLKMAPRDGDVTDEVTQEKVELKVEKKVGRFNMNPTDRDNPLTTAHTWLAGKRVDDNIGNYWRVHDKLYDLNEFIQKHPGGRMWIELTVGTDVTEAFETHHIGPTAEQILQKYFIKNTDNPRNSPYTFKENGFYETLKRKARPVLKKVGTGPTKQMTVMHDLTTLFFVFLCFCTAYYDSYMLAIPTGINLTFTIAMAHNFFHQRDNFRMYYHDLCGLSSFEQRITHAISHHLFTNSIYDWEISAMEPYISFLPNPEKNKYVTYLTLVWSHMFYYIVFLSDITRRFIMICFGLIELRPENLLPLIELIIMCSLSSSIATGFWLWCTVQCVASFFFLYAPVTGTHHHPEIWHQGDAERTDQDWGLCQLDTVRDRVDTTGNLFVVAATFGDHTLHHLFPTVDHSKLHYLYPVLFETCKEFGIPFSFKKKSYRLLGFYKQILNSTPNKEFPGYKNKKID